jgi:hypothetical protein
VTASLNQQSVNMLADTGFNLGMWTPIPGATGLSITAGQAAFGGNALSWVSSGVAALRQGYYQVVNVFPGEVLSLYGYVNAANASTFSGGLGWALKPTGSEGGTTVYCASTANANGFVGWTPPCSYTVPNSGVTQVSVVGNVGSITVPSGQSVYLSNPMLSFGSAAPFSPGVFKGLQGAAGNVLSPANLCTGSPAAGKYCDGTGAWTALPGTLVADVDVSVGSFAVPANTCYGSTGSTTPATFTMTGLTTAMGIAPTFTTNASAITGWGTSGGLNINAWASGAGTGSYLICNPTGSSITGGAITFRMLAR